jgi:hypothetical protein
MKTRDHDLTWDLDGLVHPSQVFDHPRDVLSDPDLSLNEKRAILASWASDACAIEASPALRRTPNGGVVTFDDIMDALGSLDREFAAAKSLRPELAKKTQSRRGKQSGMSGPGNQGAPLH